MSRRLINVLIFTFGGLILCCVVMLALMYAAGAELIVYGSGKTVSEDREVEDFVEIELWGAAELYVDQGDKVAVSIEADEKILPFMRAEVVGDKLIIDRDRPYLLQVGVLSQPKVYVTVTEDIQKLVVSGSGVINTQRLKTDDLHVLISGSADVRVNVEADSLVAEITGSGNISVKGEVNDLRVIISGSGNYDGYDLTARNVDVDILGSGSTEVYASDNLDVNISGSGDVYYMGDPEVKKQVLGSGNIRQR